MIFSLKTTSYTAALFIALVLGLLLLLGSRQYSSQKHFEKIIERNEKVVFQYATIREHITESLLEEHYRRLSDIIREVEDLNTNISQILQDPDIPDQYRISFAGQVDLTGIILLLRSIGAGDLEKSKVRQLSQEVRILGDRLLLFDRVIVNYVKRSLLGFQSVIIGILAIVVFVIIYVLLFWHRQVAIPLFTLIKQVQDVENGKRNDITLPGKAGEVTDLTRLIHSLLCKQNLFVEKLADQSRLRDVGQKISRGAWQAPTREAVFTEACKTLLTNEDYCLTWVGVLTPDQQIVQVAADGSTTMSRRECEECLASLFEVIDKKGDTYDAARQALLQEQPVVIRDLLAGLPTGPYKNTPFSQGQAFWAALPIQDGAKTYGILNIYSTSPDSFPAEETAMLAGIARELAHAITALETSRALQHAESCNQQMTTAFDIMTVSLTPAGTIAAMNSVAQKAIGYAPHKAQGTDWLTFLPAGDRPAHEQVISNLRQGSSPPARQGEMTLIDHTGAKLSIRYLYASLTDTNGDLQTINWVGIDITDPNWLNISMSRLHEIQKNIFQTTPDLVLALSADGVIMEANPAALTSIGIERDALIGNHITQTLFKDGQPMAAFRAAVESGGPVNIECTFPALSGEYRVTILPIHCQREHAECMLLLARDITTEKQLKADTVRAARLAIMGELAVTTAHEVNNISNGLINYTQLLLEDIGPATADAQHKELLQNVINEGERIAQTVQQILIFSTDRLQIVESVSIEKIIEDCLALLRHQLEHDAIQVKIEFPSDLPLARINVQKMQHVVLNLLLNACDALNLRYAHRNGENKRLEIKGETVTRNGEQWLTLYFTDWGTGIHPNINDKLFDPFFTTKPNGTGLGLSICKELIQEQLGNIQIKSVPGNYTTVTVTLPLAT
jgi:PAS domain S-box-containing protein